MKLEPIPNICKLEYDSDSLVYCSDDEFYYGTSVPIEIINDIRNKSLQIYTGYYEFKKGWKSPKIFLIGRGKESNKFRLKIQNFLPYTYIEDENGEYKTYLGKKVKKISLKGMHPSNIKVIREKYGKNGKHAYEADILFVRRFMLDVYDLFKSKELIQPKIAILDIETDFPVSDNIISFAINDMENPIWFQSKYDTKYTSELALDLYERIIKYDIVTGWNVAFDIGTLFTEDKNKYGELEIIDKYLNYAVLNRKFTKEEYINNMCIGNRYYSYDESKNLIEQLIRRGYLKEEDGIVKLGDKHFEPDIRKLVAPIDMLAMSRKMYAQEIRGKWSLDNVGQIFAGISKVHIGSKHIRDLNEEDLLYYNVMDSLIPEIIDCILGGLEGHLILSWSVQCLLEDSLITAVVNDHALLRAYHKAKIVLPSRDFIEKADEPKYKAAEPVARPGIYKGLITLDLKHAYPNAVISKNVSPETKDINGKNIAPNGIRFNDKHSVFIDTLKDIMIERGNVKSKMNILDKNTSEWKRLKSIDFALKTQAAAFSHGIFGWANSRMRDYEVADSITAIVRNMIDTIKEACDTIGLIWNYAHTDSIYINQTKEYKNGIEGYLNDILSDMSEGDKVKPILEFKGYYPHAYIHSAARNVLIPEDGDIDNPHTWNVTGMNFMRSEVPPELANIEIELIKMKLKKESNIKLKLKLKEMIKNLKDADITKLGIIKPLTKPINKYGRKLKDGTYGGFPYHIKALLKAKEEYGFDIKVGEKFMILPILTDEVEGVRTIRRKRIDMAFDIDKGLPNKYKIDFEYYLGSNLFGKIHNLFEEKSKALEDYIIGDPKIRKHFGLDVYDKKLEEVCNE